MQRVAFRRSAHRRIVRGFHANVPADKARTVLLPVPRSFFCAGNAERACDTLQREYSPDYPVPHSRSNTFVTFCAGSDDYYAAGLRLCRQVQSGSLFSRIVCYTDHDLRKDELFWSKHGEFVTNNKRGFGYWIWKAYIILKELSKCKGVVVYCDAGCEYMFTKESGLSTLFDQLREHPIMIPQTNHRMILWTKRDVLIKFGMDTSAIHNFASGEANIVLKHDERVVACLQEWWETMQDYHMLDDSPSHSKNHSEFVEHRHDQAILNLCLIKHGLMYKFKPDPNLPISWCRNRTGKCLLATPSPIHKLRRVIFYWCIRPELRVTHGLGDILRGMISAHQFARSIGATFEVSVADHPIAGFLKYTTPPETTQAISQVSGIKTIFHGEHKHTDFNTDSSRLLVVFSNMYPAHEPDEQDKNLIVNLLALKPDLQIAPIAEPYRLVHVRCGDNCCIKGDPCPNCSGDSPMMKRVLSANLSDSDFLITDCLQFKKYLLTRFPFLRTDQSGFPGHMGHISVTEEQIKTTLVDVQRIINANDIVSISCYPWPSGFVTWISTCFNISMTSL